MLRNDPGQVHALFLLSRFDGSDDALRLHEVKWPMAHWGRSAADWGGDMSACCTAGAVILQRGLWTTLQCAAV